MIYLQKNLNTMTLDDEFKNLFDGRLKQLFLYITDECMLRCKQCLYKTTLGSRSLPLGVALWFTQKAYEFGARKLTYIGGEPSMYGREFDHEPLYCLIEAAASTGYEYIRLDTNGLFSSSFLSDSRIQLLSNMAFSLDGHTSAIHDSLRGQGTFNKSVRRLSEAVARGIFTTITTCVHPGNIGLLREMAQFACDIGAKQLNFHPLFKMGIERDIFTGATDITPSSWLIAYEDLEEIRKEIGTGLHIRAPRRFVPISHYEQSPEVFDYCPTKMGERMLVHPNGDIRICALCIGTPIRVAKWCDGHVFTETSTYELADAHHQRRPCMRQTRDFGDLSPLCISFKEGQQEPVWTNYQFDRSFGERVWKKKLR